jgi:hypothetical protein
MPGISVTYTESLTETAQLLASSSFIRSLKLNEARKRIRFIPHNPAVMQFVPDNIIVRLSTRAIREPVSAVAWGIATAGVAVFRAYRRVPLTGGPERSLTGLRIIIIMQAGAHLSFCAPAAGFTPAEAAR